MRVNFGLKGIFTSCGIATAMLILFFTTSSFTKHSNRELRTKHVNLILREIGHRLLLQSGDSTSRVLPVTETREGTFLLQFEKQFVFSHDSLIALSKGLLPEAQFPSGYIVTVHDCLTSDIVYGFQLNNFTPDLLACQGRRQPSGCYMIEFAFPDFYKDTEQNKSASERPNENQKADKVDRAEIKSQLEETNTKTIEDLPALTKELKSVEVDPPQPKLEEFKSTNVDFPLINLVYVGALVLVGVVVLRSRIGKAFGLVPIQNQDHSIIIESVTEESLPELAALGKFSFDVKDRRLLLDSEVITLTDKECKILELLNSSFGELIPRETLMQKIWFNQGVITGRSLDMFVSKLRKKLSGDPDLRITNVHGKGYKLEMSVAQS